MAEVRQERDKAVTGEDPGGRLFRFIEIQREAILDAWLEELQDDGAGTPGYRRQAVELLDRLLAQFRATGTVDTRPETWSGLERMLRDITANRAKEGATPKETAQYVLSLKKAMLRVARQTHAQEPEALLDLALVIQDLIDEMALLTLSVFMEARERVIQQQSLSLLELSAPVIQVWNRILLLPLVGVIDTTRARDITENLLNAIARAEAQVTLIDITGVPVLDTSVAGHLIKTVSAAQMMGTRVILTGVSPEGAQTLVKLGIDLSGITTRGSLKSGVAESFRLIGRRIVVGEPMRSS